MKNKIIIGIASLLVVIAAVGVFIYHSRQDVVLKERSDSISSVKIQKKIRRDFSFFAPMVDELFVRYNKKDFGYICENMMSDVVKQQYSKTQCQVALKSVYDYFGQELSLNYDDSTITKNFQKEGIQYLIEVPANFKNYDNAKVTIQLFSDKKSQLKLNGVKVNYEL